MNADDLSYNLNQEIYHKGGSLWTDGWYLYSSGEVTGPYNAEDIFQHNPPIPGTSEKSGNPLLVSRKGLSRWYELRKISQIYKEEPEASETKHIHRKKQKKRSNKKKSISAVSSPIVGFGKDEKSQSQIRSIENKKTTHETAHKDHYATEKTSTVHQKALPANRPLSYYHLILRGRLRLGSLQGLFACAFWKFFLSFGLYLKFWYEQAVIESMFHLDDPLINHKAQKNWMVLIPGIHIILLYKLANLILQMEIQNHYRRTSPITTIFLSLFPPLAIFYLQRAMNQHWCLHVIHSVRQNKVHSEGQDPDQPQKEHEDAELPDFSQRHQI